MSRNVTVVAVLIAVLVLGGVLACALVPTVAEVPPTPTFTPTKTPRPTFTPTPAYTPTPVDTPTPVATDTPLPTDTPTLAPPTDTPIPLPPTNTPKPAPPTNTPVPPPPPTAPPQYPFEIVYESCPEQEKEATWVGGGVIVANGEPIMQGFMVEYRTLSNRGKTPWADDLKTQPNPWIYDIAKFGKLEQRSDWGGNWMNFYFDLVWHNPDMEYRRDTYRDELDVTWMHTIVEWWVWVVSPSGEQLSEKASFKTYSHPKWQAGNPTQKEADPDGGPPQCFVVFKHR
jgi:hypothetical protein